MTGPTLDDLLDELRRGRVYEATLTVPGMILDGVQEGERIIVDPRPAIVDTALHEALHRLKPRWGERSVRRHIRTLMGHMQDEDIARAYQVYRRVVKRRRPVRLELD